MLNSGQINYLVTVRDKLESTIQNKDNEITSQYERVLSSISYPVFLTDNDMRNKSDPEIIENHEKQKLILNNLSEEKSLLEEKLFWVNSTINGNIQTFISNIDGLDSVTNLIKEM